MSSMNDDEGEEQKDAVEVAMLSAGVAGSVIGPRVFPAGRCKCRVKLVSGVP
jgi:hypothetical protein